MIGEPRRFTDCQLVLPMPPVDGPPAASQTHRQGVPSLLGLRSTIYSSQFTDAQSAPGAGLRGRPG